MKITSVTPVPVSAGTASGVRNYMLVKIETDEGITGWGEATSGPMAVATMVEEFGQQLIGQDPGRIEQHWQTLYHHFHVRGGVVQMSAISGIEIALWDIVGKAANQPIYNLLGGQYHEKLRAYAYMPEGGFRENPEKAGEIAQQLLEQGNTACKLDPFQPLYPIPRDIPLWEIEYAGKIFESIRNAVGNRLEVGIGTHGQLTTYSAIRVADYLEPYHPFWFEEPVPPENVEEMARVAAHTSIPIATGERLVTKYEFSNLLEKQAAQIIQLDVGQCGGIMEAKKIASIAEAHYAMIAPHMACGPIVAAAAIQVDTCSPNFLIQEANLGPLHHVIFKEPLVFENGFITPPTGPGLGIELNEDVIKRIEVE
jgi:2-dehydro-3-deoxyphosphogalactonate aldolase